MSSPLLFLIKRISLDLYVLEIISYLIPFTVTLLSAIALRSNKNKGVSKDLFTVILVMACYFFFTQVVLNLDIGEIQIMTYIMYPVVGVMLPTLLYVYCQSLLDEGFTIASNYKKWIPLAAVPFASGVFAVSAIDYDTLLNIIKLQSIDTEKTIPLIYSWFAKGLNTLILPLSALFFGYKALQKHKMLKQRYRQYYGELERENEKYTKRLVGIFLFFFFAIGVLDFHLVENSLAIIFMNLLNGFGAGWFYFSGSKQINMYKYRMYKLSSHHHEID